MEAETVIPYSLSDKSIAVLPFVNMSADPENEYFSDGITEEIINALTKIDGLKVIARTSSFAFKGKNADIREIANQLGVKTILEGSVRKASARLRITAQLINAEDGTHFWSENFDREMEDIFKVQDEISLLIAEQIRANFGHFNIQEHLVDEPTKSIKAYELFLQGRFYQLKWTPDSIKQATEFYEAATQIDPAFSRSYYGNHQCYGLLGAWGYMPQEESFPKAISNFEKGAELNKNLPEYNHGMTGRFLWGAWNFPLAYESIKKTLKDYPHYTDGLEAMTELLLANGYFEEAKTYIYEAQDVDPLSANHHYTFANILYMQRNFTDALVHIEKSLYLNPQLELATELKVMCLIWLNKHEEFLKLLPKEKESHKLQWLYEVINGDITIVTKTMADDWLRVDEDRNQLVPYELFILANSNYKKQALKLLSSYIAQKRGQIINFRQEPFLYKLHEFEEFHQLHTEHLILQTNSDPGKKLSNANKVTSPDLKAQIASLLDFINSEEPYLDTQLSLSSLAAQVKMHPNRLSFLINEHTGSNFNEFINQYRLAHFKKIAHVQDYNHLTILGRAFESGFNSKTVFNAYFKKIEGVTPGEWIKGTSV